MPEGLVTIGVIGAGAIARMMHLPILAAIPGARVVALAEPAAEARSAAAELAGRARCFTDAEAMLAAVDIDAVVICASTPAHADLARAAFAAGKPVYLEKPLALTLGAGHQVVAAQRAAGTVGMIGFMLRFAPAFVTARERIAAGAIGEVVAARSVFVSPPGRRSDWRRSRANGGGALLDLLSHHADLARWLLDAEIESVAAQLRSVRSEDDTAAVTMRTTSGLSVQTLLCTSAAEEHRFEIIGTEGRLVVDPWRMASPEQLGVGGSGSLTARLVPLAPRRLLHRPGYRSTFRAALSTFVSSVATGRQAAPDLVDGLISLAVVEAAQSAAQSAAEEPVQVQECPPIEPS